jgi:hypothetical protein
MLGSIAIVVGMEVLQKYDVDLRCIERRKALVVSCSLLSALCIVPVALIGRHFFIERCIRS